MQTRKPLSLVTKKTTQTQNTTTSLFRLLANNTREEKKQEPNHKAKNRLPFNQQNSKTLELQGRHFSLFESKNKKQIKNKPITKEKHSKNKANTKNRKADT